MVKIHSTSCRIGYQKELCCLSDLNLDGPGLTALVGPNGSGKSTLIRTLCGLHPALDGEIFLDDHEISSLSSRQISQLLAVVLTERVAMGGLTVWDIVAMGRHPFGKSAEDDEHTDKALQAMRISQLADLPMDSISDGERQKTMIARAICQDTPYMVLDEPTAFLDFQARMQLFEVLTALAEHKRILFSSHDLRALLEVDCDLLICAPQVRYFPREKAHAQLSELIRMFKPAAAEKR